MARWCTFPGISISSVNVVKPEIRHGDVKVITALQQHLARHNALQDAFDSSLVLNRNPIPSGLRKHGAFTILPNTKLSTITALDDLMLHTNLEYSSELNDSAQHLSSPKHCPDLVRPVVTSTTSWTRNPMLWSNKTPKPRRGISRRAVFSDLQRQRLEDRFQTQKYISKPDRKKLSETLGLKDSQVKVWFQNRRMKWRNSQERELLICRNRAKNTDENTRKLLKKGHHDFEDQPQWN
ncbi:homeobox protein ceh-30-like [Paramacrobiotus metropolitanus]|uniref:homeobox protein ceh-30-like n=1 Tax=Paramacrobiotus metropolitanus TaxID=2943436 RepID=UPI00244616E6|nr:homeobox protein ceh-30-like [Paramacrobiotus metropolitanus]